MPHRPTVALAQQPLILMAKELARHYEVIRLWEPVHADQLHDTQAIVTMGESKLAPNLLESMPRLGLIACFTVGYDGIDLASARERGIAVTHTENVNDEDVADHAIGLIIGQRRAIISGDQRLRSGDWKPGERLRTRSLKDARIGIVGLGNIGMAIAERAEALRMRISWWGPNLKFANWPMAQSLWALAEDNDILVIAARAHAGNVGMISRDILEALGPEGLLVNVARGQIVDEQALIAALKQGSLGAAALDVFETEPTPTARWADVPNTVLTPHTAGATIEAARAMSELVQANLAAFFAGKPVLNPIPDGKLVTEPSVWDGFELRKPIHAPGP